MVDSNVRFNRFDEIERSDYWRIRQEQLRDILLEEDSIRVFLIE